MFSAEDIWEWIVQVLLLLLICWQSVEREARAERTFSHKVFGDLHYPFVRAFITAIAYAEEIRKLYNPSHPHSMVEIPWGQDKP